MVGPDARILLVLLVGILGPFPGGSQPGNCGTVNFPLTPALDLHAIPLVVYYAFQGKQAGWQGYSGAGQGGPAPE